MNKILFVPILLIFTAFLSFSNQKIAKNVAYDSSTISFKVDNKFNLKRNIENYAAKTESKKSSNYQTFKKLRTIGFAIMIPSAITLYVSVQVLVPLAVAMGPGFLYILTYAPFLLAWAAQGAIGVIVGIVLFSLSSVYLKRWLNENKISFSSSIDDKTPSANMGIRISL
ncbi:MAG TPA: hypothetical protein PLG34_07885 [Spirochaetota bacterium]|jgi:hypothetical protein|nr:MAG: hypothetical protein BWX91_00694 [Spirochaetes bacterium ADurb.Bin133]HNZ26843.1 hypothetical protein [Spirochaetota bacterium]HPY87888.1 hypothetical protein [Spirochaetota bacterium]HQB61659.1 hypothetical protein [Spirochaetota bacterium]